MRETKALPLELESVLLDETTIKRRVRQLGREISASYCGNEITVITVVNGAIVFTADLLRQLAGVSVRLDCIRVSSYGSKTRSRGQPRIGRLFSLDVAGRDVLLVDDILDTGKTLATVADLIRKRRPASLRTCVLLDKRARREIPFEADFVGFSIPDKFVVGYGLDFAERYRNLPCIGVLKPRLRQKPAHMARSLRSRLQSA